MIDPAGERAQPAHRRQKPVDGAPALIVIGAGGHGRVVADAAAAAGVTGIAFVDDKHPAGDQVLGYPVLGPLERQWSLFDADDAPRFFVAVGSNERRLALYRSCIERGLRPATVIHPAAVVSRHARIGAGSVVLAGSVINAGASVGDAVIVNTGVTVDHDCVLHDAVHLSPGVHLGGTVEIGERSWLGVGVSVRNGVRIAADVMVGVGAAVVSSLDRAGVYVGVPARLKDHGG